MLQGERGRRERPMSEKQAGPWIPVAAIRQLRAPRELKRQAWHCTRGPNSTSHDEGQAAAVL